MPKIRVLVVDDSVVMRRLISEVLARDPNMEVAGIAPNGRIALQKLTQVNPDIVTMDVEMPELDGVAALKELRRTHPKLPVIMFSALTQRGAQATLEALAAGATDYVTKPMDVADLSESVARLEVELLPRIRVHFNKTLPPPLPPLPAPSASGQGSTSTSSVQTGLAEGASQAPDLVVIGSSTGGPMALETLFKGLTQPLPVPLVLVQHMPPMFTQMLAQRLNQLPIPLRTHEAAHGMPILPGNAYLAPGGFHLTVHRDGNGAFSCRTNTNPPENSCRPAVDVLFRSAVEARASLLGVVLTGMGQDGLRGCQLIREQRGQVVVQDQATSIVWGMPGVVAQARLAHAILPIEQIADEITRRVRPGRISMKGPRNP